MPEWCSYSAGLQVVVPQHHGVEVLHLEGGVLEARLAHADAQEGVVVHGLVAPVAAHEGDEDLLRVAQVGPIGVEEAEARLVPLVAGPEVRHDHHAVTDALHLCGPGLQVLALARRWTRCRGSAAEAGSPASGSSGARPWTTSTGFPSGIREAHPRAPARSGQRLDGRRSPRAASRRPPGRRRWRLRRRRPGSPARPARRRGRRARDRCRGCRGSSSLRSVVTRPKSWVKRSMASRSGAPKRTKAMSRTLIMSFSAQAICRGVGRLVDHGFSISPMPSISMRTTSPAFSSRAASCRCRRPRACRWRSRRRARG